MIGSIGLQISVTIDITSIIYHVDDLYQSYVLRMSNNGIMGTIDRRGYGWPTKRHFVDRIPRFDAH